MKPTAQDYNNMIKQMLTAIRAAVEQMLTTTWTDKSGTPIMLRPLQAPYIKATIYRLREQAATAEDAKSVFDMLGDAIANTIEEMLVGEWVDGEGHKVLHNTVMLDLGDALEQACHLNDRENGVVATPAVLEELIADMLKGTGIGFTIKKVNLADLFKDEPKVNTPPPESKAQSAANEAGQPVNFAQDKNCTCGLCQLLGKVI